MDRLCERSNCIFTIGNDLLRFYLKDGQWVVKEIIKLIWKITKRNCNDKVVNQKILSRWKFQGRGNWSRFQSSWRAFTRIDSPISPSVCQTRCFQSTKKGNTLVIAESPVTEWVRCQTNCAKWWKIRKQRLISWPLWPVTWSFFKRSPIREIRRRLLSLKSWGTFFATSHITPSRLCGQMTKSRAVPIPTLWGSFRQSWIKFKSQSFAI